MKKIILVFIYFIICTMLFSDISETDRNRLLELEDKFQQAMSLSEQDSIRSMKYFRETAEGYTDYINKNNTCSSGLYYNTGNAWYMAGDYGRAILNYRKGLLLDPRNRDLAFNLHSARLARTDNFTSSSSVTPLKVLFFWHYYLNDTFKMIFSLLLTIGMFLLILFRIITGRKKLIFAVTGCMVLVVIFSVSLCISVSNSNKAIEGVVITDDVVLRKGDNDSYEPAIDGEIHNGTEFRLLNKRNGWIFIDVQGIENGWIKEKDVLYIK